MIDDTALTCNAGPIWPTVRELVKNLCNQEKSKKTCQAFFDIISLNSYLLSSLQASEHLSRASESDTRGYSHSAGSFVCPGSGRTIVDPRVKTDSPLI